VTNEFKAMQIGVIGLGQMGCGITQVTALAGHQVRAVDLEQEIVSKAMDRIEGSLDWMAEKGRIDHQLLKETLGRIQGTTALESVRYCDLVIEAVHEEMEVKKAVFRRLDSMCQENTILASNTSLFSITSLASGLSRAAKVVGLHFFNPTPLIKLVEVVKTMATSEDTVIAAKEFVRSIDKVPVIVRDQTGFLVIKLLTPFLFDAIRSLSSGLGSVIDIDRGMRYGCGHPTGPLAMCDVIGLDILVNTGEMLFREHREVRFAPPPLLRRLVEIGDLGVKSGRGFYDYEDPKKPLPRNLIGL
jgi:3-hydroxybutyryl-CoA dehydrogenase